MTVKQNPDGTWGVYRGPHSAIDIAGPFVTMADAWRWIDRHEGEPISPAEKKSDRIVGKILGGAA